MRIVPTLLALSLSALVACARPAAEPAPAAPVAPVAPSSKVGGCRNLFLYAANDEATQVVIVDVDAKTIGLKNGAKKTFDLATPPKGVRVWLDVYLQPAHIQNVHCTKTPTEQQMAERYAPAAGSLTIELQDDGVVSASVDGATFVLDGRPAIAVGSRRFDRIKIARSAG